MDVLLGKCEGGADEGDSRDEMQLRWYPDIPETPPGPMEQSILTAEPPCSLSSLLGPTSQKGSLCGLGLTSVHHNAWHGLCTAKTVLPVAGVMASVSL